MKKQKQRQSERYKLSAAAKTKLDKYIVEIRKGIQKVCELHTYDSAPSLAQSDFEMTIIDTILGQTATAVSASIKQFIDGLQAQKEAEVKATLEQLSNQGESSETPKIKEV